MQEQRPPLGLMPEDVSIWKANQTRIYDILKAIRRYNAEGLAVPVEWLDELDRRLL